MTEHKVVEQKGDEEGTVYVVTMHLVEAPLTLGVWRPSGLSCSPRTASPPVCLLYFLLNLSLARSEVSSGPGTSGDGSCAAFSPMW